MYKVLILHHHKLTKDLHCPCITCSPISCYPEPSIPTSGDYSFINGQGLATEGNWLSLCFVAFYFIEEWDQPAQWPLQTKNIFVPGPYSEVRFGTLMHAALLGSLATCRCPHSTQKLSGAESHWGYQPACPPTPSYSHHGAHGSMFSALDLSQDYFWLPTSVV